MKRNIIISLTAGAALLALAACHSKNDDGAIPETEEQIENATNAGREAARVFVNSVWKDTFQLQERLLNARAEGCRYDTAGPKQKAAYDSAFVQTIRDVRPEVYRELVKASSRKKQQ